MSDLIFRHAILDGKPVDIAVTGNRFSAVAPNLPDTAATEIDASGLLAFPPFYNCHTHIPMVLFRGYADDLELFPWLNDHIWPAEARLDEADVYAASRLAITEMLHSGTVFFNDSYFFLPATIRAVEELGLRACIGLTWLNTGNADACARLRDANDQVYDEWRQGKFSPRIQLAYAPHAIYTVPEADLRDIAERSARDGMLVHMHLAETEKEFRDCQEQHGGLTPVEYLREVGLLNERARLAHAVWLTDCDIELVRDSGAVLVTNATSNLKLCSGTFRFRDIVRAGIPVTLGTDGCASNNAHSMFSEMKFAALAAKLQSHDPTAAAAPDIFRAATAVGAAAFVPEAGAIAPGRLADLMLVNPDHDYLVGDYNPVSNLVYAAESSCVDTILCDGEILMRDHYVPHEDEILAEARRACDNFRR